MSAATPLVRGKLLYSRIFSRSSFCAVASASLAGTLTSGSTRTLEAFQRQAHHHINPVPQREDFIQWAALMQHHGAPTRLLDWTYSFYVAAYFAIEDAAPGDECAVWAIDSRWLNKTLKKMYPDYIPRGG